MASVYQAIWTEEIGVHLEQHPNWHGPRPGRPRTIEARYEDGKLTRVTGYDRTERQALQLVSEYVTRA